MIGVSRSPDTGPTSKRRNAMNSSSSRFGLSLVAVAVVCLVLAGCTGTTEDPDDGGDGDSGGAQSIKWLIEEPEDAAALKALKQHVADDFTKDSGIEVEIDTLPF